ncbi:MAG TPA: hypothetical protein VN033_08890 [Vulgatibacter sp.]|nr:hypothetical protein [Vulgatibacter sp.]
MARIFARVGWTGTSLVAPVFVRPSLVFFRFLETAWATVRRPRGLGVVS